MEIRMKWYYRLGFLLLLFIVLFTFLKLQQLWLPILKVILTVLLPFLIAAFITYLLHPVVEKLHEAGLHRGLAVFIIYFLFFGGLGWAFYKGIPAFIVQLKDLSEHAPEFANQYRSWIDTIQSRTSAWPDGVQERIDQNIASAERALDRMLARIIDGLVAVVNSLLIVAIIPFIAFYLLKDYLLIKKAAWYLTPRTWRKPAELFLRDVDKSLGGYIRGQLLVCFIIAALSTLSFWIIGMRYPLLLGFIVGVTNIIPYFGPFIGAIPAAVLAATISPKMVVLSVIIVFSLQFLEGNILSPLIVGKSLHMHPLFIMLALLAGGEVGGIIGLILAVPVMAVAKVAIVHAKDHFTRNKQLVDSGD
ncbi:AI-2E family transporter [Bacillus sp. V3-13]|uniref:AI-2E family transporter n=1 Tax=Bacillus sp. V3-13 TaxID=2053728 RepID=UPI000C788632|nr:AI-2E family transporter [Bacillus sp. V3-13]PLR78049.1 AI-2E family transporter [Bacillus sp. V3-13]